MRKGGVGVGGSGGGLPLLSTEKMVPTTPLPTDGSGHLFLHVESYREVVGVKSSPLLIAEEHREVVGVGVVIFFSLSLGQ